MDEKKFETMLDQHFSKQAELINAGFESQQQYSDKKIESLREYTDKNFDELKHELEEVKGDMNAGFYRLGSKIDNNVDSLALRVQRIEKHLGFNSEVIEIK